MIIELPQRQITSALTVKILAAEGTNYGLAEVEIFPETEPNFTIQPFIKLTLNDDFAYSYARRESETTFHLGIYRFRVSDAIDVRLLYGTAQLNGHELVIIGKNDVVIEARVKGNSTIYDRIIIHTESEEYFEELHQNQIVGQNLLAITKEYQEHKNSVAWSKNNTSMVYNKMAQVNLPNNRMCYHPQHTKSVFFLPFVATDFIQQIIFLSDNYFEIGLLQKTFGNFAHGKIAALIRKSPGLVIDIGANIGNHTLFWANELGASNIVAFEPVQAIFSILQANITLNNLTDKVTLYCQGLSESEGIATTMGYDYSSNNHLKLGQGNIKMSSLDSFEYTNVVFIKIAVEDMILSVLRGARNTLENSQPYVMLEAYPKTSSGVISFMEELGYKHIQLDTDNYLFYFQA